MAKLNHKHWPKLANYVNEYGLSTPFDLHLDAKVRSDGCYVVLAFDAESEGRYILVDVASDGNGNWEMQNDGSDYITKEQWKKLKIVPECDWYEYPDEV